MDVTDSVKLSSPSVSASASGDGGGSVRLGFQAADSGDGASVEVDFMADSAAAAVGLNGDSEGGETKTGGLSEQQVMKENEAAVEAPEDKPQSQETETKTEVPEDKPQLQETETKTEVPEDKPQSQETVIKTEAPEDKPQSQETETKTEVPVDKPQSQETETKTEAPEDKPAAAAASQETETKTETPERQHQEETETRTETPNKPNQEEEAETKTKTPKKPPQEEEAETKTKTSKKPPQDQEAETKTKTSKKPSQEATDTNKTKSVSKKSSTEPKAAGDSDDSEDQPASRGVHFLGIDFAPLNTPMRRRLQTLAVLQWLLSITVLPVLITGFLCLLLFTPLAPLVLAYAGWVLIFDRNSSQRGGRRVERIRNWSLWRHYRDYFPIRLVKSAELDPAHNYLIGYHPHGIISCGAFCNFGTEATGFGRKFPGIRPYLLTLRMNFFWPLLRGYFLWAGLCDVSRPSLQWILGREGGGNAAIIVVGGAQEALDARPGNYRLTLLRRKGFARMALQTGAHLVPCFSFGENDLFRQAKNPPGSRVRAFQQLFKGAMGSSPPLFYGRGVFNYTFGLLPFRHEIITVVGAPIPVAKCASPTPDEVDSLHKLYMQCLADLFDQHKASYGVPEDVRLEFV